MRILHLWDNYAPGLFDQSFEICREEGVETKLICMNLIGGPSNRDISFVRQLGKTNGNALSERIRSRLRRFIDEPAFRRLARAESVRFRPDALHVHYGTTGALLAADDNLLAAPFVLSFYGFDISQGVQDPRINSAYRRLMRRRPLVHVLCDEAA